MEDHNVTAKFSEKDSDLRNRGQGLKFIIYDTTRPVPLKQSSPAQFRNAIRPFSRAEYFTCPVQELKEQQCFQVDTGGGAPIYGTAALIHPLSAVWQQPLLLSSLPCSPHHRKQCTLGGLQ